VQNIKKYFGDGNRVKEPFDVYVREILFLATGNPDDACARLCVADTDLPADDYIRIVRRDAEVRIFNIRYVVS